jgi:hypothetical protein
MSAERFRQLTGLLFVATPVTMLAAFTLLQVNFEYPAILRQPAGYVLERFQAGGAGLLATWYLFALSAAVFIPLAVMVHQVLKPDAPPYLSAATASGVTAGLVQVLGLIRWPFLVPALAQTYLDPAATPAQREAAALVFQAFNVYAGAAVGEHLGYLFTAGWTVLISLALWRSSLAWPWLGGVGLLAGLGILAGVLEPLGVPGAGAVNAVAYTVWAIWLVALGVIWLRPAAGRRAAGGLTPAQTGRTRP